MSEQDKGTDQTGRRRRRRRRRPANTDSAGRADGPAKSDESGATHSRQDKKRGRRGDGRDRSERRPRGERKPGGDGRPRGERKPRSESRPRGERKPGGEGRARDEQHARDGAPIDSPADTLGRDLPPAFEVVHDDDFPAAEKYGDDSEFEAKEIILGANLPEDPSGDHDPTTATDAAEAEAFHSGPVANLVGVKFHSAGKIYLYDGGERTYRAGQAVVVDSDRETRIGTVAIPSVRQGNQRSSLKRILRTPNSHDNRTREKNAERERAALATAKEIAGNRRLGIKVFRADFGLGDDRLQLYYSTDDKVDTREFSREVANALGGRVELRQTGVRDEAKMVGGIGSCGQELCCTTWLPSFVPVSIKHAKDQGLVLNPTKVSGQCGRLKCCLVYEQETYAEMRKGMPKLGKRVITDDGEGRVVEVDVLKQRIRVNLVGGDVQLYTKDQVQPMFPSKPQGGGTSTKGQENDRPSAPARATRTKESTAEDPAGLDDPAED